MTDREYAERLAAAFHRERNAYLKSREMHPTAWERLDPEVRDRHIGCMLRAIQNVKESA